MLCLRDIGENVINYDKHKLSLYRTVTGIDNWQRQNCFVNKKGLIMDWFNNLELKFLESLSFKQSVKLHSETLDHAPLIVNISTVYSTTPMDAPIKITLV